MRTDDARHVRSVHQRDLRQAGAEVGRYIINGLTATFANWAVMRLCLDIAGLPWAWLAFWIGSLFGISVSFLGSRYFVFRRADGAIGPQAAKFLTAYAAIALLVSGIMAGWSDWYRLDTNAGFFIATGFQVVLTYAINKVVVFT